MTPSTNPPGSPEAVPDGLERGANPLLESALACADRGFRIHPLHGIQAGRCSCGRPDCSAPGKHPRLSKWPSKATTDSAAIRAWWARWPEANVGLLTGSRSGVIVLDIDPRNDGDASLAALEARHGELPRTPRVRTGGGGVHVYFEAPNSEVKSWHPGVGLDLQGDGGRYVVLPPSLHSSGASYEWLEGLDLASVPLAPLPPCLRKEARATETAAMERPAGLPPRQRGLGATASSPWAEAALRRECEGVARAEKGTRNSTLNKAAFSLGQLVPHLLEKARVESELLAVATACGLVGDDGESAVRATLRSGLDDGMQQPRGPHGLDRSAPVDVAPSSGDQIAGSGSASSPQRRIFVVRGQEIALADEAIKALAQEGASPVYVRGRHPVRVVRGSSGRGGSARRPPSAPVIERYTLDSFRNVLASVGKWIRRRGSAEVEIFPPEWLVRSILARSRWPFPVLEGVIEAPTLRPDGSILDSPGYDEATELLYLPSCEFPRVPAKPTTDDVCRALQVLLDPFRDFPFREDSDRAAAIAAILSTVARYAIDGCVPLFAVRATAPGTGKSLLVDVIALIATGRRAARMSHDSDDAEMRKRILAIALEAERVVLLDNVDGRLGSPSLAAAITARTWKDRLLGVSATAEAPLQAVWFATGNNMTFRKDLGRRVVNVDLDARRENPEDRMATEFRHPDLCAHVERIRPTLVVAALTLLRGYYVGGRPAHDRGAKVGSFEAWDDLVRGACLWVALADPVGGRERIRQEDDSDRAALGAALAACRQAFGTSPFTASDAVRRAEENRELGDALLELAGRDRLDGRRVGNALRGVRGRIVDGLRFGIAGREHKMTCWQVEDAS